MKLVQITDCHLFANPAKTAYLDINPLHSLIRVTKEVSLYKPDLLVITGDVSGDGTQKSYEHLHQVLSEFNLNCNYIVLPGNHDKPEDLRQMFEQKNLWLTSPIQVVNDWCLHFVSSFYKGTLGNISEQDLTKLKSDINQFPLHSHMVFVHHNPVETNSWMDKHQWINRAEFNNVIQSMPQVKGVVFGHIHQDFKQIVQGIQYLGCPSTCWQWANTPEFALSQEAAGFRVLELHEQGQFSTSIKRIKG